MTIIRSPVMGFCSGVQNSVDLLEKGISRGIREGKPVYSIGPLIHNEQYLDSLKGRGVRIITSPEEAPPGVAVIRAHGISPQLHHAFIEAGFTLLDGTCGRVKRSQQLVAQSTSNGMDVIIAGDAQHGEVSALIGHASSQNMVHVVGRPKELRDYAGKGRSVLLIAQTTFSREVYRSIEETLREKKHQLGITHIETADSICPATRIRQEALTELVQQVEGVVVVGGKDSSNTKRLYEHVCRMGIPAWHISHKDEVNISMTQLDTIGITAGASTPSWVVDDVVKRLQEGRNSEG